MELRGWKEESVKLFVLRDEEVKVKRFECKVCESL